MKSTAWFWLPRVGAPFSAVNSRYSCDVGERLGAELRIFDWQRLRHFLASAFDELQPRDARLELDPAYVDTAIRRWQALTSERARHAGSGQNCQNFRCAVRRWRISAGFPDLLFRQAAISPAR